MFILISLGMYHIICRVKQSFQAMEVCSRPPKVTSSVYDVNQNTGTMIGNFLPSSSGNFTLTFNNHLNSLTSQVMF